MAYSDFYDREDVYPIILKTLKEYFSEEVKLKKKKENISKAVYYSFPRLNSFVPIDSNKEIINFIKRDNRITNSYLKSLIMSNYIFFVFKFPNIFSQIYLVIDNPQCNYKNLLIYPGNKKIKIINVKDKYIDNILKTGFANTWLKQEIAIRINPKWDFILPLSQLSENIYREDFLIGFPYTRVNNKKIFVDKIEYYLKTMQKDSKVININLYINKLSDEFKNKIECIKSKRKRIDCFKLGVFFNLISKKLSYFDIDINIVFSHGDFQEGNLFIEKKTSKLWILDWETWGERSQYYDRMLFYYGLRNSNKLIKNLNLFKNDKGNKLYIDKKSLGFNSCIMVLELFILEDILWQLDETLILSNNSISNGLKKYLSEDIQKTIIAMLQ